jgi:thiosulfate/3-mercaptopyruvate sulfurtransferase
VPVFPLIDPPVLAQSLVDGPAGGRAPVLLDIRWTLAGPDRGAYRAGHLPGARFVDLDAHLAGTPGPGGRHPLPDPGDLERVWRSVGIDDDSTVVVYDGSDSSPAARAWWLLRWSGLSHVRVLDGGLQAWRAAGLPVVEGDEPAPAAGSVTVRPGSMPTVAPEEVAEGAGLVIVDARAANRFRGEVEPIDPVAGHIPGAVNLPFLGLLDEHRRFRPAGEVAAAFAAAGVGPGTAAAAYCGSGVTACLLVLAGATVGLDLALYPGSYSQWCALGREVAAGA